MPLIFRPLDISDIPRLIDIRPGFRAHSIIQVTKVGVAPFVSWHLEEHPLPKLFDKGRGYDFDATERENIRVRHQQANTFLEVAVLDGRIVGILDMEERAWNHTAWIWNIMLDEDVRRQGIGRQMIQHAIAWSHQRGLRAIMLETQSNNVPACHFYARMGFQLVGLNEVFYTNEDVAQQEVALFWAYLL